MKLIDIMLTILLFQYNNFAQENNGSTSVFNISEIYLAKGVIFSENSRYIGNDANNKIRFTPSLKEIRDAEKILLNSLFFKTEVDTLVCQSPNIEMVMDYYRQYFGYIESDGSKIIVMYFMNVKERPFLFEDWNKICSIGFGDEYYKNSHLEWVNITNKKRIFK